MNGDTKREGRRIDDFYGKPYKESDYRDANSFSRQYSTKNPKMAGHITKAERFD